MTLPKVQHGRPPDPPVPVSKDHIKREYIDVPYAHKSPTQKLDIYLPNEGDDPFPVIASIHGGAFKMGDKSDVLIIPRLMTMVKHGYAAVSVNYRLSGEAQFPALVQDVKAAVRWIRANADKYHFNSNKIAAWGGSAGGYLATMLGVSAHDMELSDLSLGNADQPCNVQAVVDWFGPTDFLKMDEQLAECGFSSPPGEEHNAPDSPEALLMGQPITQIPELVKKANPETYICSNAPFFFIQHGTRDMIVPVQQSINLAKKLEHAIGMDKVTFELLEGAGHGDPMFKTPDNLKKVFDFLDRCLR